MRFEAPFLKDVITGPMIYKTAEAAMFIINQSALDASLASKTQTVPLANSSGSLHAAYSNNSVILAFQVCN